MHPKKTAPLFACLAVLALVRVGPAVAQPTTEREIECPERLARALGRVVRKEVAAGKDCRVRTLEGRDTEDCEDRHAGRIAGARAHVESTAAKSCASTCSLSGLPCIDDVSCPPNGNAPELCAGNGSFSIRRVGFPGPFCGSLLGGTLRTSAELATCTVTLAEGVADDLLDALFGEIAADDLDDAAGRSALRCLAGLPRKASDAAARIALKIAKCRTRTSREEVASIDPANCIDADERTARTATRILDRLTDHVGRRCSDADVARLDLCGAGIGGVASVAEAQACIADLVSEAAQSNEPADERDFVGVNLINVAYPSSAQPRCGDGLVNQSRSQFQLLGEECDGDDDDACPGECIAPGDLFQCSCADRKRSRRFAFGSEADLDIGWTGAAHNSRVSDGAGYFTERTGCDCDAFDPVRRGNCIEPSPDDPVCEEVGTTAPRCESAPDDDTTCDQQGDTDGVHENADCAVCDDNSLNPGAFCRGEDDCQSRCIDTATNLPTGATCDRQADCASGQVCLGRCDFVPRCVKLNSAAPLALSSAGTPVCTISQFASDVVGTSNVVTGENAHFYDLRSITYLGETQSTPCPVCGGFCADGPREKENCDGRCEAGGDRCRFDADCARCAGGAADGSPCAGDEDCAGGVCDASDACGVLTPDCPQSECNLQLICNAGDAVGEPCRIESATDFGTTSSDCPPAELKNISGIGLFAQFAPFTSEPVDFRSDLHGGGFMRACTAPGLQNYECPCPGGAVGSQPNGCDAACDAGAEFGVGCSTADVAAGELTRCVGGAGDGEICDEDSDCPGGSCSGNPTHCTAPASSLRHSCSSDSDCDSTPGAADGVCSDACPAGRCVLLCSVQGGCAGGLRDGSACAVDAQCPGGVCDFDSPVADPEEGLCAGGPTQFRCAGRTFLPCAEADEGTPVGCEDGVDGVPGNSDDVPGAGVCAAQPRRCFINDGAAEGGDIFNGRGDPTEGVGVVVYCVPQSIASSVNVTGGLPGPGRLRQPGNVEVNYTSLP